MSEISEEEMERTVLVGGKPPGNYVSAALVQLQDFEEVHIRARGRDAIGTAVVASEILRDRYDKETSIETQTDIKPDTKDYVAAVHIVVADE